MNEEKECNKIEINVKSSPILHFDFSSFFPYLCIQSLFDIKTLSYDTEPGIQLRKYLLYTCQ